MDSASKGKQKLSQSTSATTNPTLLLLPPPPPPTITPTDQALTPKLAELRGRLAPKPFKTQFVDSLVYLICLEHRSQQAFDAAIHSTDLKWSQLEYAMGELKKIIKQKPAIQSLINKMQLVVKQEANQPPASVASSADYNMSCCSNSDDCSNSSNSCSDKIELFQELDDLNNDDLFSLVKILIRFLFKLIKSKNPTKDAAATSTSTAADTKTTRLNKQFFNLKLILISCLADLFNFEDIKLQAINDSNLKCLLRIFAVSIRSELEATSAALSSSSSSKKPSLQTTTVAIKSMATSLATQTTSVKTFYNAKKYWTKMCRLAANLCVDQAAATSSAQVKSLFVNDFFAGLCKCVEKQNQMFHAQPTLADIDSNMNDIEFLHSLIRFLKYSCEMNKLKQRLLEYRFLVFLCRFIHRYNKKIQFSSDSSCQAILASCSSQTPATSSSLNEVIHDTTATTAATATPATQVASTDPTLVIVLNEKCHSMCKELVMNYLQLLDSWPGCSEFYNQIIEGNLIEHLVWLQLDDAAELKSITSRAKAYTSSSSSSSSSSSFSSLSKCSLSKSESFNFVDSSFSLLYKLCRDYHACRAEFGRVGGLAKFISKIESTHQNSTDHDMKLIEVLCFSCKESVNRFRLKEQNHLSYLLKLQQRLKREASSSSSSSKENSVDSTLFNKLLVALCGFVHDPDSMSVLLANGLVESFLSFLNDSYRKKPELIDTTTPNELNTFRAALFSLNEMAPLKRSVLLKNMLAKTSNTDLLLESKKRKHCEQSNEPPTPTTTTTANKSKKQKLNQRNSNAPSSPPPPSFAAMSSSSSCATSPVYNMPIDYYSSNHHYTNEQNSAASPSESYCSLSPACNPFSPTFSLSSPPNTNAAAATAGSRCTSAIHFHNTALAAAYGSSTVMHTLNSNSYQFSPSPSSNDTMGAASPKFNWSSSGEDLIYYQTNNNTIQFSPSIKNEDSDEEEVEEEDQEEQDINEDEEQNEPDQDQPEEKKEVEEAESKQPTAPVLILTNQQSIETINRTEGCVFYVLSQLSHGDKPSTYMFNNFEAITVCLLSYLKNAQVRNPRALRILNRLTKNTYCFSFFILIQLPFKLKTILFNSKDTATALTTAPATKDIEKEMNVYLNSNKVFFDAHSSFPSFESIEFTLINNLKSQCISSSDHGYLSLIQMIKQNNHKRQERLACALVAPYIIRNSKALHYIMIQLSGVDLILDMLLMLGSEESADDRFNLRNKSILCLRKVLAFVNYKRDMKKLKENFEQTKYKLNEYQNSQLTTEQQQQEQQETVTFLFKENDETNELKVNKETIMKKSEYFNALLSGQFMERSSHISGIEIKEVTYEAFQVVIDLIQSDFLVSNTCELTFELCIEIVLACDRLMLTEYRDFFVSILANQFMSLNTFVLMFKLAWFLNISVLEQATIDYFLSLIHLFKTDSEAATTTDTAAADCCLNSIEIDMNLKCATLVDYVLDGFKQNDETLSSCLRPQPDASQDKQLTDHLKKCLKIAIGEIIKK